MSKTIHRITELISTLDMSARQFDLSIGTANGYTLRMKKNNASVGSDVIERISKVYPNVNLVWLITGHGDMFISKDDSLSTSLSDREVESYIETQIHEKFEAKKASLMSELLKEINGSNL